jgi:PAS domain S-box-containing protein
MNHHDWKPVAPHRRILVVDDNHAIHEDFRKILTRSDAADSLLRAAEARLFGIEETDTFAMDSALQGEEALQLVERSIENGLPYAMAFVDVRMPPGWDGIETTERLWKVCPDLQIVFCTAHAECSWEDVLDRLKPGDRLLILKKPFDTIEVLQMANSLTEKWRLLQQSKLKMEDLDRLVKERTAELERSRLAAMSMMEEAVRAREKQKQFCEDLELEMQRRAKLEEKFREKASLLDLAADAILVLDLENRITYCNKSAEQLYGWSAIEMIGRPVVELHTPNVAGLEGACAQVMRNGEWVGELCQKRKDGMPIQVTGRWTLVREPGGKPKSILAVNTRTVEGGNQPWLRPKLAA